MGTINRKESNNKCSTHREGIRFVISIKAKSWSPAQFRDDSHWMPRVHQNSLGNPSKKPIQTSKSTLPRGLKPRNSQLPANKSSNQTRKQEKGSKIRDLSTWYRAWTLVPPVRMPLSPVRNVSPCRSPVPAWEEGRSAEGEPTLSASTQRLGKTKGIGNAIGETQVGFACVGPEPIRYMEILCEPQTVQKIQHGAHRLTRFARITILSNI